jgi:hypothetical protein
MFLNLRKEVYRQIFQYPPNNFDAQTIAVQRNDQFAVYGLTVRNLSLGLTVVYVGKSKTLRNRLNFWLSNPPGPGTTHFYSEAYETEAAMDAAEQRLIQELQPRYNTLLK